MHQTKVEWGDRVWSPITGCKNDCLYCNSRRSSRRFASDVRMNLRNQDKYTFDGHVYVLNEIFKAPNGNTRSTPFGFAPTYHRYSASRLETLKTPMSVLVSTNGEMFGPWVRDLYIKEIFDEVKKYPEQRFLFQTKFPERYMQLSENGILPDDNNCWYGWTVTDGELKDYQFKAKHKYIVVEPLLGPIIGDLPEGVEWMIFGADTGKYSLRVTPQWEWIESIVKECRAKGIPVFMLDSIKDVIPEEQFTKDKPKAMTGIQYSKAKLAQYSDTCRCCGLKDFKRNMILLGAKTERGSYPTTVGFLCYECYKKMSKDYGLDDVSKQ
ncbi:MAG: DUF5131 family protein [Eubacterium sp.]|nr:DUF5131 family protein [Eubacterium sp.]